MLQCFDKTTSHRLDSAGVLVPDVPDRRRSQRRFLGTTRFADRGDEQIGAQPKRIAQHGRDGFDAETVAIPVTEEPVRSEKNAATARVSSSISLNFVFDSATSEMSLSVVSSISAINPATRSTPAITPV